MHHGLVRVALCFLAKFGLYYFLMTSVVALASMYVVLVIYYNNIFSEQFTGSSKPVSIEHHSPNAVAKSPISGDNNFGFMDNLRHIQQSLTTTTERKSWENYGWDLVSFVRQSAILPTCQQGSFLTIFIVSAPRNFKARDAIRQTWCSQKRSESAPDSESTSSLGVQCIFLLGRTLSTNIQTAVGVEAKRYGDILQGLYLDTYRNLTLKVLHGLHWSQELCSSEIILKTDDDCFVNVPVLLKTVRDTSPSPTNLYTGHVMVEPEKRQVIRDPFSKWEVSVREYSPEYYPPYASGSGYILSQDLVEIILAIHESTNHIHVEDAYIGILLNSVGVEPIHSSRFAVHEFPWQLCNLLYFVVMHHISPTQQKTMMDKSVQSFTQCKHNAVFNWN